MENVYALDAAKVASPNYGFMFHIAQELAATCVKVALVGIILYNIAGAITVHNQQQVIPVKIEQSHPPAPAAVRLTSEQIAWKRTTDALTLLECPTEKLRRFTQSCVLGAQVPNVDPVFIACLIKTESEFKPKARSSMGYKGVMQTPTATGYVEADTMHGCNKLQDHLQDTHGNLVNALTNYKGSPRTMVRVHGRLVKSEGYKQALAVLALYKSIKARI